MGWRGFIAMPFLVVVGHLDPGDALGFPAEDDPSMVVDPDGVPSPAIALQRLEPVARWYCEITQAHGSVQVLQLGRVRPSEFRRDPPCHGRQPIVKEVVGQPVPEGPDHGATLSQSGNARKASTGHSRDGAVEPQPARPGPYAQGLPAPHPCARSLTDRKS